MNTSSWIQEPFDLKRVTAAALAYYRSDARKTHTASHERGISGIPWDLVASLEQTLDPSNDMSNAIRDKEVLGLIEQFNSNVFKLSIKK